MASMTFRGRVLPRRAAGIFSRRSCSLAALRILARAFRAGFGIPKDSRLDLTAAVFWPVLRDKSSAALHLIPVLRTFHYCRGVRSFGNASSVGLCARSACSWAARLAVVT